MNHGSQTGHTFAATSGMTQLRSATRFSSHATAPPLWPEHMAGQPGKPAQVLLVDDDPHMRMLISQELLLDPRILLMGEAGSVREGRRMIEQHDFDVLMVDLNLGDGWGFELIAHMRHIRPAAEAVVISALEDEQHALHAFELGATGYLVKNSWFGNFPQAVLQVVNGGASITPSMARRLLRKLEHARDVPSYDRLNEASEHLSEREKEILKIVAVGYTSAEIGERLNISCMTVNTHIKNIYRKLHVRTRAQAVNFAAQHGLL